MADKTIRGCISKDGQIYSGSGYNPDYLGGGIYEIKWDKPFSDVPAVVLTQNYKDWNNFGSSGGSTLDNAVLIAVDMEKCKVKTGGSSGAGTDRNFTFIAIGAE